MNACKRKLKLLIVFTCRPSSKTYSHEQCSCNECGPMPEDHWVTQKVDCKTKDAQHRRQTQRTGAVKVDHTILLKQRRFICAGFFARKLKIGFLSNDFKLGSCSVILGYTFRNNLAFQPWNRFFSCEFETRTSFVFTVRLPVSIHPAYTNVASVVFCVYEKRRCIFDQLTGVAQSDWQTAINSAILVSV